MSQKRSTKKKQAASPAADETRAAFTRLHAAATTTAADQPVNVQAGDLQVLLNALAPLVAGDEPAPADPGPDPEKPPAE